MCHLSPFKISTSKNSCAFCISLINGQLKSPVINTSKKNALKSPRIKTSKKQVGGWVCSGKASLRIAHADRLLAKLGEQKTGVAAVLVERRAELSGQNRPFFARLDPVAEDDQGNSRYATPFVNHQNSADRREIESGVNRMAKMSVWPGADEFMVLFQSDSGAPILSQVPARPESDGDADPGEYDAGSGKSVAPMHNEVTKKAYIRGAAEEKYVTKNLQSEDAIPRRVGFLADGPARLQRAHQPVDTKHDPRPFGEVSPNHLSSAAVSRESAQLGARFSVPTPGSYTSAAVRRTR